MLGMRAKHCRVLNEIERAWLAAIIDGEGSIMLLKRRDSRSRRGFIYVPTLLISNTNKAVLVRAWELIGEGGVYPAKKETLLWKMKWLYNGSAGVMRLILPQILPYLIVKKGQAKKTLEYLAYIKANRIVGYRKVPDPEYYRNLDLFYAEIRVLNHKGRGAGIS